MHPEGRIRDVIIVSHEIKGVTIDVGVILRMWHEDVSLTYPIPSVDDTYTPDGSKKVENFPVPSFSPCIVLPANVLTEPFVVVILRGTSVPDPVPIPDSIPDPVLVPGPVLVAVLVALPI